MEKVELIKNLSVNQMVSVEGIDIIYDEALCYGRDSRIDRGYGQVVIFIKPGLPDQHENFLLLHELGHYFLHMRTGISDIALQLRNTRREENEANIFACLYLLDNQIHDNEYYDTYLCSVGVPVKIADYVQECIHQYKQVRRWGNKWMRLEC
ncbi:ImmA/IrrE family metallo-endopeptidase [Dysgonomonas capnocytophagoides]|uniref:ImmA/IrrE family metallo-endopeptidase n=1 Tax=Dysgonomonas capnocytophagoides TaxID=45254 RepID=UPI002A7F8BF8|nr:ImmA/IrrE family metallo-endopeptidase [Dysgonomonas capnocytophagoides]